MAEELSFKRYDEVMPGLWLFEACHIPTMTGVVAFVHVHPHISGHAEFTLDIYCDGPYGHINYMKEALIREWNERAAHRQGE